MARFHPLILAAPFALLAAGQARAAETACWFEAGVVVVSAEVAGIAGDYILDTGTARTTLQKDRVQSIGIDADELTGDVRLAGLHMAGRSLAAADLDVRTWNLPTPVAGVIGADVLRDYVVDVEFAPCRVRLSAPGVAPRFHGRSLALSWDLGRPTVEAEAYDEAAGIAGAFVVATGANAPVRLADDLAQVPGAARPQELYPDGVWLARLPGLGLAGELGADLAGGLMKPEGNVAGVIGGEVLAHFRLRFDFPAGRLVVAPPH